MASPYLRVLAVGAALSIFGAAPTRAQTVSYANQCATGSMVACWSIAITTTAASGGGTNVVVRVTNWQGTTGYPADPSLLNTINIWNAPGTGTGNDFVQTASMTGTTATNVNGAPAWSVLQGGFGGLRLYTFGQTGGLSGCTLPSPSNYTITSNWSTCGGGELVMSFSIAQAWSVPVGVPVTLSAGGSGTLGSRCDLGLNNPAFTPGRSDPCGQFTPPPPPPTSVPEPEGWLLMASGLLGLAATGYRRRSARD